MHEIDLNKKDLRTDLILEKQYKNLESKTTKYKDIEIITTKYKNNNYTTIYFNDATDKDNDLNLEKVLIKERFTINELQERLRANNINNLADVEYAILETSGQVSIIQKPNKRTTIPEDFNIMPEYEGISYDLVVDGKIMNDNLKILNKTYEWLKKEVNKFNIEPEEALLVTVNAKGDIFCQKKEKYNK